MTKLKFLKSFGLTMFCALSLSGQSLASEEITLRDVLTSESPTLPLIGRYQENIVLPAVENVPVPVDNSQMMSSDELFRIAQATTPSLKLDLGVKKDEVVLDAQQTDLGAAEEKGPTFIQRITKEEYRPGPLQFFNKNGYEFEAGPIKSVKMGFYYLGTGTMFWPYNDSVSSKWKDGAAELTIITKFRNNKTGTRVVYNFLRNLPAHPNDFMEKFSELGVTHEFNKHNQIHIGQTWRLPIGVEGYQSTFNQDLPTKAQIGRTFGDTRSFGVRNIGTYKYMDYDIGVYDSTRYWRDFGNGLDMTGWITLKPLANLDSKKYGKLTLGTGLSTGKNDNSYSVWGGYIGYDYKRFHNKFEYSRANGYNAGGQSRNEAEGFYNTMVFDITKNLKLIGRYDLFNPNVLKNNSVAEYTGGITYVFKNSVKLGAAYTYKHVQNGAHSNAISIQTQVRL